MRQGCRGSRPWPDLHCGCVQDGANAKAMHAAWSIMELEMAIVFHSNGSGLPVVGEEGVQFLLDRLAAETLDRRFESCGNFIDRAPRNLHGEPLYDEGWVSFFGNFLTYSHVFNIATDDADVIARLEAAILANKETLAYRIQPPPFDRGALRIERHRFSTTQGEVSVYYAGEKIGRYGDKIEIRGAGRHEGLPDTQWEAVARRVLAERHIAAVEASERQERQPA